MSIAFSNHSVKTSFQITIPTWLTAPQPSFLHSGLFDSVQEQQDFNRLKREVTSKLLSIPQTLSSLSHMAFYTHLHLCKSFISISFQVTSDPPPNVAHLSPPHLHHCSGHTDLPYTITYLTVHISSPQWHSYWGRKHSFIVLYPFEYPVKLLTTGIT